MLCNCNRTSEAHKCNKCGKFESMLLAAQIITRFPPLLARRDCARSLDSDGRIDMSQEFLSSLEIFDFCEEQKYYILNTSKAIAFGCGS